MDKYISGCVKGLKENNPNLTVKKANRAMGNGIVITDKTGTIKKAKFYHSKSYHEFPAGWHTLREDDLNDIDIDYFIFNLEHEGEFFTFIFTRSEILNYIKNKEKDLADQYYFYFQLRENKIVECRDGEVDVSKYLNRWKVVSM